MTGVEAAPERAVAAPPSADAAPSRIGAASAIEVDQLARRFGDIEAVKDVSFNVAEGELFGFLGPNGAGKSTTINMLCTLLHPSGGRATVNGFDVAHQRSDVRRSIGLVFQQTTVDEYLSAEQNLLFHAYAYDVPAKARDQRIRELLEMVELWDRRKGRVRTFSGGMKRRLEIARGLIHHPKVLFLDEPTIGLDPQTRRHIWEYLLRLREQEHLTIFRSRCPTPARPRRRSSVATALSPGSRTASSGSTSPPAIPSCPSSSAPSPNP